MELNIKELNDDIYSDDLEYYGNEEIPENKIQTKKIVNFSNDTVFKPTHQPIPKVNAKISRPKVPPKTPKLSYEDILAKMGMVVSDGKLHIIDKETIDKIQQQNNNSKQSELTPHYNTNNINNTNVPPNSYIYNKYFKQDVQPQDTIRRPKTIEEYKRMVLEDYIQRQRIKQMKSTKLLMPTSNISISPGVSPNIQNKLFSFPKR